MNNMNDESHTILLVLNTFSRDSMLLKLIHSVYPLPAVSANELTKHVSRFILITDLHNCTPVPPVAHNNKVTILRTKKEFPRMVGMIFLDDSPLSTYCYVPLQFPMLWEPEQLRRYSDKAPG